MKCTMQQLRASRSDWEATPDIIPEGSIALVENTAGGYFMKIGDGVSPFCYLPFFGSSVVNSVGSVAYLSRTFDYRLGALTSLTVYLPDNIDDDFYATLTFNTKETITASYPEGIVFTGSDCINGRFSPLPCKHYTLFFWYDGTMQCTVRGVALG